MEEQHRLMTFLSGQLLDKAINTHNQIASSIAKHQSDYAADPTTPPTSMITITEDIAKITKVYRDIRDVSVCLEAMSGIPIKTIAFRFDLSRGTIMKILKENAIHHLITT